MKLYHQDYNQVYHQDYNIYQWLIWTKYEGKKKEDIFNADNFNILLHEINLFWRELNLPDGHITNLN